MYVLELIERKVRKNAVRHDDSIDAYEMSPETLTGPKN